MKQNRVSGECDKLKLLLILITKEKKTIFTLLFITKIWQYLGLQAKIDKTEGTLFS